MLTRLRELAARTRASVTGRSQDRDFEQEWQSHLAMLTEDNIRRGMTPEEARRAARLRLGGQRSLQEQHREARGLPLVDTVLQDARHSLRALRRDAALTTFAILIVGIGVGASATVFSAVSLFTADECRWNGPKAVLLSHRVWTRRFAADPAIVGRPLVLNDEPVTVVGVLPESFDFATIFAPGRVIDLYSPFPLSPETNAWGNTLSLVGRLRDDATLDMARTEAKALGERITRDNPRRNVFNPVLTSLRDRVSGSFRPAMALLSVAVAMVMLIVCANLSNLLLARSMTRQKEMAIRAALGAGRRRLIQQALTESVVLSGAGAVLGLMLTVGGTRLLAQLDAIGIPLIDQSRMDARVLGFALFVAIATGITFGVIPALRASTLRPQDTLKELGRGTSEGRHHGWMRRALVIAEVALACILLAGAGLLMQSLVRVLTRFSTRFCAAPGSFRSAGPV